MKYSLNDIYPHTSQTLTTSEQTVAPDIESDTTNYSINSSGQKSSLNKSMVFGSLIMVVGLMVALHFLGGE